MKKTFKLIWSIKYLILILFFVFVGIISHFENKKSEEKMESTLITISKKYYKLEFNKTKIITLFKPDIFRKKRPYSSKVIKPNFDDFKFIQFNSVDNKSIFNIDSILKLDSSKIYRLSKKYIKKELPKNKKIYKIWNDGDSFILNKPVEILYTKTFARVMQEPVSFIMLQSNPTNMLL